MLRALFFQMPSGGKSLVSEPLPPEGGTTNIELGKSDENCAVGDRRSSRDH
jgi:hypothetical protein